MSETIEKKPEAAPAPDPLRDGLEAMRDHWAGAPPFELAELAVTEVLRLRALLDGRWDDAARLRLHGLQADGRGGWSATFEASILPMMAAELAAILDHPEAGNYVGVSCEHDRLGTMDLILQRRSGKSPGQMAAEWRARAEDAEGKLALANRELGQLTIAGGKLLGQRDAALSALRGDQAEHDRRVAELLAANNREVERRRDLSAALRLLLPEARMNLEGVIRSNAHLRPDDAGELVPDRSTMDPTVAAEVERVEAAIAAAEKALGMVPGVKVGS